MCDDFYLVLSSSEAAGQNPANFSINLPEAKSVSGSWKVGLKEIHCSHWPYVEPEPISFLVLGTAQSTDDFEAWIDNAVSRNWANHTPDFLTNVSNPRSHFPNFPHATILTYYKKPPEDGQPATYFMTPEGKYDSVKKYIDDLNYVLNDMERHMNNLQNGTPMYFTYTDEGKVTCAWNYFQNYHYRLFVFPILGQKSRELLGMGNILDKGNRAFRKMIGSMVNRQDSVLPHKHMFTQANDNILVTANIIEQTGIANGENGQIMRVIENPGKNSDPLVHLYFNDTNYIKVVRQTLHNIHIKLISTSSHDDMAMTGTTTVVLHFTTQNNCEKVPATRGSPSAVNRSLVRRPSALPLAGSLEESGENPALTQFAPGEPRPESEKAPKITPLQATISTSIDLLEAAIGTIT